MRCFLGAFGQPGHAFPMLALGRELASRGHDVTLETWSRWRSAAEAGGMRFAPAPEYPVFPTRERPLQPYEAVARATTQTRPALAAAEPDVVVHDILTLAPALAAELQGVATATLIPHVYPVGGPGLPPYSMGARPARTRVGRTLWRAFDRPVRHGLRVGRDQLNDTRRRVGLPPVSRLFGGLSTELVMVATLPQLEYPRAWPDHVRVVGPLMWEPACDAAAPPPGNAPLVLVATSTAQDPEHRLLRAALAGLADEPVRVLATWNGRLPMRPLPVPANARLVEWMSYAATMPRCDLVVCHVGHGTLVRALSCGRPVLAVPHVGDMAENAARVSWAGAGLRLPWPLLCAASVRWAVRRALHLDRLHVRAAEIGAWATAHPGPARAADLVEDLAARATAAT